MKSKQFNFKDIKGMLSRDEMKQIKGGCGVGKGTPSCGESCEDTSGDCSGNISCPRCKSRVCSA